MKSGINIHGPWKRICNNFGDPVTFHLAPSGQDLSLPYTCYITDL